MIIDGKKIAQKIKEEIRALAKDVASASLVIFYVGENPVIESYLAMKKKVGAELGIAVEVKRFPGDVAEDFLISEIKKSSAEYSGAIVQLPLPPGFDKQKILDSVPYEKDVDVLSRDAFLKFKAGETEKLPPVVFAISSMIKEYNIELSGKNIVIIGRGALVGAPVSAWLSRGGFGHQTLDKDSDNNLELIKNADVIISGVGEPNFIKPEMLKDGVVLFDAGTSTSGGKLAGDIDPACYEKSGLVSPVPGGIGPLTVVGLFKNLFL